MIFLISKTADPKKILFYSLYQKLFTKIAISQSLKNVFLILACSLCLKLSHQSQCYFSQKKKVDIPMPLNLSPIYAMYPLMKILKVYLDFALSLLHIV